MPLLDMTFVRIALLIAMMLLSGVTMAGSQSAYAPVEGLLSVVWGDAATPGRNAPIRAMLTDDEGRTRRIKVSDDLLNRGLLRWNGQRVRVYPRSGDTGDASDLDVGEVRAAAVQLVALTSTSTAVTGSQPWISILCKFADVAAEPKDLAFFEGMYANMPGGLDHFWRELSYDQIDVVGSTAVDWVTLPGNQADYAPTPGSGTDANLNQVFDDCTAAVDDIVDFSRGGEPFVGINIMLNEDLDCCAWGGNRYATLDGVAKNWRTTWNPPWSFRNEGIIAHEMGHGFGLHHANNFDDDGNPYDSPWDVMSAATAYGSVDETYGELGKHTNVWHKDILGWFPPTQRFEAQPDTIVTLELDALAAADAGHYRVAIVPVDADHLYSVEARQRVGLYDAELPGNAVIIHQVDVTRPEPAWAVDADVPPANYGDNPGTMWEPGETFIDPDNGLAIKVERETANGFVVTIGRPTIPQVFRDGFDEATASLRPGSKIISTDTH